MMRTMPPVLDEPARRAVRGRRAVVTPLRHPPARRSVVVRAPQRRTFGTFVLTIGSYAAGRALILARMGAVFGLAETGGGQP